MTADGNLPLASDKIRWSLLARSILPGTQLPNRPWLQLFPVDGAALSLRLLDSCYRLQKGKSNSELGFVRTVLGSQLLNSSRLLVPRGTYIKTRISVKVG